VIAEMSRVRNWLYVVLSRVKKLENLFLLKPIPDDIDCSPSPEHLDMMNRLRKSIQAPREEVDNLKRTIKQTIDEIKAFCESKKQKKNKS
jgi:hypothetical protein